MPNFESYIELNKSVLNGLSEQRHKEWEHGLETNNIFPLKNGNYLVHVSYYNTIMAEIFKNGKDPYGIKNVNFSRIDIDDDRWEKYKKQRLENGFDDSELWCLDSTIAKFILPRLKRFIERSLGTPARLYYKYIDLGYPEEVANKYAYKDWSGILDKIVWAFENYDDESYMKERDFKKAYDEYREKIKEGLQLFAEWFGSLSL